LPSVREKTEEIERLILSPLAVRSADSHGRERPEPQDPIRTCFQRDRDRILHSKAFRRLKHKTQVFIDPDGDHYRTRLTHTLEVSQISRTVARALRLNEDLTEAIALGHDLGHPPFGHAGETALDESMRAIDPSLSFHHYEQSLRVAQVLERDGEGLNLTREVLGGIGGHSKGRKDLSAGEKGTSMEADVVRICDRIAYLNHDLDDAYRAGIVRQDDLPESIRKGIGAGHSERITAMVLDLVNATGDGNTVCLSQPMQEHMNDMKEFMFDRVYINHPGSARELERAKEMLRLLFRTYHERPEMLPAQHQPATPKTICDWIAGMTDRFAARTFEDIYLPRVWRRL